jgi:hypothetical protein
LDAVSQNYSRCLTGRQRVVVKFYGTERRLTTERTINRNECDFLPKLHGLECGDIPAIGHHAESKVGIPANGMQLIFLALDS